MPEICYKRFDRKVLIGLLRQSLTTEQEPKAIVDSTVVWIVDDSRGFLEWANIYPQVLYSSSLHSA